MSQRRAIWGAALLVVLVIGAVALSAPSGAGPPSTAAPRTATSPIVGSSLPLGTPSVPNPASPGPSSPYTFDDEFNGPGLSPIWQQHLNCCGQISQVDPGLATVANGVLSMGVQHQSDGWHGSLIDTLSTWRQTYGYFAARIQVPQGGGLWPAFWSYTPNGTDAEVDTMEVCGNPVGANGGNDVSLLHTTVHWGDDGSRVHDTRTVDLSQGFHVYAVDWRATSMRFYLDGQLVWTFSDAAHIPQSALPLILDLGIGGQWCGPPSASTLTTSTMLVDWVRVSP